MLPITIILGRVTKDPVMQTARNSDKGYISLDIATTQRNTNGEDESVFYQCYFNTFLAERLIKAGVKKGTCLCVYGELTLRPFIYKQGKNQGMPDSGAQITVKDWNFTPSNRSNNAESINTGGIPNGGVPTAGMPNTGVPGTMPPTSNGGMPPQQAGNPQFSANVANTGGYQNPANTGGYPTVPPAGMPMNQGYAPTDPQYTGDGFSNVPEYMAGQLPFN